jgi:hypothetical protein
LRRQASGQRKQSGPQTTERNLSDEEIEDASHFA